MLYEIGIHMLYDMGSSKLLRYWKLYVVGCGNSDVVMKLEIICCTMWEIVRCYDIRNRMLYDVGRCMLFRMCHVGCGMLLQSCKSYAVPRGMWNVVTKL